MKNSQPARRRHASPPKNCRGQGAILVASPALSLAGRPEPGTRAGLGYRPLSSVPASAPPLRFSIIVTSYNQREFIREAVESALSVRNAESEVIVVDDASTDGSQEILRGYGDVLRFASLETHAGACAARNHGASLAKGEYLIFLDGDDVLSPWSLKVYTQVVRRGRPELILAHMRYFRGALPAAHEGEPREMEIVEYKAYAEKDRAFAASASSLIVKRDTLLNALGWSEDFLAMQDQDLLLKLSAFGPVVQVLAPSTSSHRFLESSISNQIGRAVSQIYKLFNKEYSGNYPGGPSRQLQRRALIGGVVFFWTKKAMKNGRHWDALVLFARGLPMVFAAVVHRFNALLAGRRPSRTIAI
jgi:glycosyltransferase involved in cell wall biosynthesis